MNGRESALSAVDAMVSGSGSTPPDPEAADRAAELLSEVTAGPLVVETPAAPSDSATADLPRVLHAAPAAVLMIDLASRTVSYVNALAAELSGDGVTLPMGVQEWSRAAGLTDMSDNPVHGATSPLSRVASGQPVAGEPVQVRDSSRRGSPATPGERRRTEGRLLWVTGFRLGAEATAQSALVVMLQCGEGPDETDQDRARRMELLRARAVIATDLSFTVTDPRVDGNPLVWVNPAFERLTGYGADEVGRNCRFLQGPSTDQAAVRRISQALRDGRPITEVLLNYRKDGTAFWNQLAITPILDNDGAVVNFVGVQADVTEKVLADHERQMALATAEDARRDLRLVTETTTRMTESLDVEGATRVLATSVVPAMADFCSIDLLLDSGSGQTSRAAVAHRDASRVDLVRRIGDQVRPHVGGDDIVSRVLTDGEPRLDADMPDRWDGPARDATTANEVYRGLRPRSSLAVPLRARGRVFGVLALASEEPYGRRFTQRDLSLAHDLANKAALAVDNARLYAREHDAAETLQLSLLPQVSDIEGLAVATRYLVGSDGARVGGDWYDLIALPDGAVGLAVGDVVGHDLRAAAAMGQLRGVLRSYAWEGLAAGAVLDRCDQLVQGLEMAEMATAVYARLEPAADGARVLRYANAGHPPPLLRTPDGETRFLDGNLSPLLGAVRGVSRTVADVHCPAGSVIVLYTDGLVDLPGTDVTRRLEWLRRIVRGGDGSHDDVQGLCDRIITELAPDGAGHDDVALLALLVQEH